MARVRVREPEESMRAYYSARAAEYDRIYEKPERQADIGRLREWLPPRFADTRVLEVACGTGFWTQHIAPVAIGIVALDAAVETIRIARSRVPADRVAFVVGDAYRLPFEGARFGSAFAGFWFSHVPRRRQRAFLEGLSAALAPGARVVLIDNLHVAGSSLPVSDRDADGDTWQIRRLDDGSTHRVLKNFPSESELHERIDRIGADGVYTAFDYYWAFEYLVVAR